ncbi:DUF3500 domain-containing protein [Nocardia otitidiscaviarum]|uniref:DUF3500 domain-containing protein n=1 Tax=Nocardia otitidiscaviarum TaxID=1823 RepID=UPI0004A6CB7C|nr:DUF3500 domain-containing protein [Nocardia otitidiscaviarum]
MSPTSEAAAAMTKAADSWLTSLTAGQRSAAQFASPLNADSDRERQRWFYTPTDHGGLALREQTPRQQSLAMQLMATGLSADAYATVATVMGLENILDRVEGWHMSWGRERGRDPELYWLRIFGHPGEQVWAWRLGGHHVSLNNLVVGGELVATTPCFIGADPARTTLLGGSLRPLAGPEETARQLVRSLDPDQLDRALLHDSAISDIVSGNRAQLADGDTMMHMQDLWRGRFADPVLSDLVDQIDYRAERASGYRETDHAQLAYTTRPKGISAAALNDEQRHRLRRLIALYTGRAPQPLADRHLSHYADDSVLDRVCIAWAGSLEPGEPHYYRVQGPRLLIEYDNTQRHANHAHSVWRDPVGDFGVDALAAHRARSAH